MRRPNVREDQRSRAETLVLPAVSNSGYGYGRQEWSSSEALVLGCGGGQCPQPGPRTGQTSRASCMIVTFSWAKALAVSRLAVV